MSVTASTELTELTEAELDELRQCVHERQIWKSSGASRNRLFIFVHGYAANSLHYRGLLALMHHQGWDVFSTDYCAEAFSTAHPQGTAEELANRIQSVVNDQTYEEVVACGHSMGCVFLKSALAALIQQSPLQDLARDGRLRVLLLASTGRGYKPREFAVNIALFCLHAWFWLTLMGLLWAYWLRCLPASANAAAVLHWCKSLLGWAPQPAQLAWGGTAVTTALAVMAGFLFRRKRIFRAEGVVWAATMVAWTFWSLSGWTWPLWLLVPLTAFAVDRLSALFGFGRSLRLLHAALATGVAAVPWWVEPHAIWLWPATLTTVLCLILYPWRSGLLLENVLAGSSWITGVRLAWMAALRKTPVPVTHLFGDRDPLIDDDDQEELAHLPNSRELALDSGTHLDFMLTARPGRSGDSDRHQVICDAIIAFLSENSSDSEAATKSSVTADAVAHRWRAVRTTATVISKSKSSAQDAPAVSVGGAAERPGVTDADPPPHTRNVAGQEHHSAAVDTGKSDHVVILIHGIRDYGEWHEPLSATIRDTALKHNCAVLDVVSVRYGYFSAFQFLLSGERDRATRTFLDAYGRARIRFPDAQIHVAAHSNGTYVVCNALQKPFGAIHLHNIYFAGSVVSRYFDWNSLSGGRVSGVVYSDRATADWPVGALCRTLSGFGVFSWLTSRCPRVFGSWLAWGKLGTAGVDGFSTTSAVGTPQVLEAAPLEGAHGEATRARHHSGIAEFLLTGKRPAAHPTGRIRWLYLASIIAFALVAVLLIVLLYAATVAMAPGNGLWCLAVSALLTFIVVRIVISV